MSFNLKVITFFFKCTDSCWHEAAALVFYFFNVGPFVLVMKIAVMQTPNLRDNEVELRRPGCCNRRSSTAACWWKLLSHARCSGVYEVCCFWNACLIGANAKFQKRILLHPRKAESTNSKSSSTYEASSFCFSTTEANHTSAQWQLEKFGGLPLDSDDALQISVRLCFHR